MARINDRGLLDVASDDALGEVAENFIRDGAGPTGVIDGRDLFGAANAQQHDFIADLSLRQVGHVDDCEIHGDSAQHGCAMAMDEYVASWRKSTIEAVAITGGDDGDAAACRHHMCAVVAKRLPSRNIAQRKHASLPRHGGNQAERVAAGGDGTVAVYQGELVSVQSHSGANEVVPGGRASQSCAAVGEMLERRAKAMDFELMQHLVEALLLPLGVLGVEHFGRGDMAEDAFQP